MQVNLYTNNVQSRTVAYTPSKIQYAPRKNPSFSGGEESKSSFFDPIMKPFKRGYDTFTEKLAGAIGHGLLESSTMKNLVAKTAKSKIVAHISCGTSLLISGLDMHQTLTNKNLDSQKKKTLAINQGSVAIISAVMSYKVDKYINKAIDKSGISDKF